MKEKKVSFLFYHKQSPHELDFEKTIDKGDFDCASVIFDNRYDGVEEEVWAFMILFTLTECSQPFKIVKANYGRMLEGVVPILKSDQVYKGSTVIEDDRIVIFTTDEILVHDVDLQCLMHVKTKSIHLDIKEVFCYQPIVEPTDRSSFYVACSMRMRYYFSFEYKKKQPKQFFQLKDTDDENTWLAKMTWNDKQKKFGYDETFASSMYIRGANVGELCEIDDSKVLL